MNKNPFVPTPSYPTHQPPLPPGPPPAAPGQPDYSAYWAAAAAAQHSQSPSVGGAYNPQWTVTQPGQAPQQSALYANYGYGPQQNFLWQQNQQRQQPHQQHYPQPPPPVAQPPPAPPVQQAYNPYQPQASAFQQPYVPQAGPTSQPPPYQPQAPAPQPYFPQQPSQMQVPRPNIHHTSPQHLPPAKRPRFEGPNQRGPVPPQPQFQAPPPPPMQQQGMYGPGAGRGGGPGNQMGRGGGPNARGGPLRGGKSGFMSGNRGGSMGNRGGRGGGNMYGPGNRGGAGVGQQLKNHGSRGGFYGNKDFHNRRGGSFNSGHSHHHSSQQQQNTTSNSSFRGRGQGHFTHSNRGARHDFGSREPTLVSSVSSVGKKEENRRTLTDFKIAGLEIKELGWTWGIIPSLKADSKPRSLESADVSDATVKAEAEETKVISQSASDSALKPDAGSSSSDAASASDMRPLIPSGPSNSLVTSVAESSPPSRLRIYFHTPVSPDDSHPIPLTASFLAGAPGPDLRKGKRKKLEDDDGDIEEERTRPAPPMMTADMNEIDSASVSATADMDGTGRGSVAPSVAETTSEGDWLMDAIGEDEGESEQMHAQEGESAEANRPQDMQDGDHEYVPEGENHDGDRAHDVSMDNEDGRNHAIEADVLVGLSTQNGHHEHLELTAGNASTSPNLEDSHTPSAPKLPLDSMTVEGNSTVPGESATAPQLEAPSANGVHSEDKQDPENPETNDKPLQASASFPSTMPEFYQQTQILDADDSEMDGEHPMNEHAFYPQQEASGNDEQTQLEIHDFSPNSLTSSTSSATLTLADLGPAEGTKETKGPKMPSANRLSISYAAGSRRLVVDAEIVDKLKVFRAEARVEVSISVDREEPDELKGILIEGLSDTTRSYLPLPSLSNSADSDATLPPFAKLALPTKLTMVVYLDTERPLSEPKWVKSGDVQEWLKSMFGRMFWVAGDAADGWERRIEVVDPDPAPTIWTVLEGWAANSPVGQPIERQRFLRTHMTETDNIMEILLRLVRGERATPFSAASSSISAQSISGPLLAALSPGSPHGAQQTHVSLAVLAIFRMAVEYAKKAVGDKGKGEAEERVGEIIRCLPSHLLYKSLDGIFKEWKVEKKGGR
ncbi:hypothetical protein NEOLEDRAFT_1131354 [Neolentinus lepideus HHB14362 ss-1]|uniref:Proteasome subunit alpha type 1 n=1 Tax=Neolentinus lepideus HHB14362 ss-1 TaxID=1314782 RepID=A0A165TME4_9AGAM|nr:hypothetical protein NEOLEDRAFT_1131354 [Neolentinus lepideus HHB14362 ss-1]